MEKICLLIYAEFTGYGKQRFMVKNRNALLTACDLFHPKTYDLFELIPLILHENLSFPGYAAGRDQAPHGICDYLPSAGARETFAKYLGREEPFQEGMAPCCIEGLFTIDSTGTITHNASSDIDY